MELNGTRGLRTGIVTRGKGCKTAPHLRFSASLMRVQSLSRLLRPIGTASRAITSWVGNWAGRGGTLHLLGRRSVRTCDQLSDGCSRAAARGVANPNGTRPGPRLLSASPSPALHIAFAGRGAACPEPILKAKDLGAGPSYDHWFSALGRLPRRVSCHTPVAVNRVPVSIRDGSGRIGRERHAEPLTSDIDIYITRTHVPVGRS